MDNVSAKIPEKKSADRSLVSLSYVASLLRFYAEKDGTWTVLDNPGVDLKMRTWREFGFIVRGR